MRPGGPYFTLPYPIDEVVKVDTTVRSLHLDREFWFETREGDEAMSAAQVASSRQGPLNPERDSYIVTGDANIIHLRWTVNYKIGGAPQSPRFADKIIEYIENVGDPKSEQMIVGSACQRGIVNFAAGRNIDQFVDGISDAEAKEVQRLIQKTLDDLASGIVVARVSSTETKVPNQVYAAFQAVTGAENERLRVVEAAKKYRNSVLNEVAGHAHEAMWQLIRDYQMSYEGGQADQIEMLEDRLANAFELLNTGKDYGNLEIGGTTAQAINEGKAYRTQISRDIKAEADRFLALLDQYRRMPEIVTTRLWEQTRETIMTSRIHKFIMSPAKIVLQVNRDPNLIGKWEQEDLAVQDTTTVPAP
jgi:regulator of protease activity HflC (stomatin/prohibitin superfamily)